MPRRVGNKLTDPPDVKFWRAVDVQPDGCWNWLGGTTRFGHGSFGPRYGYKIRAHRYSWELVNGPIPAGLDCCHHCDNPRCVRPDHLFIGTRTDNMRDAAAKKRTMRREGHIFAKINQEIADDIRALKATSGRSNLAIGMHFNVSAATVSRVVNRVRFGGWA